MKYLIFILTALISVTALAQNEIPIKTDGTKYYIKIYDGVTNEKVVTYVNAAGWQHKLFSADYFDGSNAQLFSFEATAMYPGYFSIVNHSEEISLDHHLMSYNWFAYMQPPREDRDPKSDKEMQYRIVEVSDGYYKLETIEKPTDGSLYNVNYTPGADALNVDENGRADFADVKSADITIDNMANKVFKFIEFNPALLFEESVARGQELYENNPDAPEQARATLFYTMEKAREIRLFGTESEMLAFQTNVDEAIKNFNQALELNSIIYDARVFIDESLADEDVKNSFHAIVDDAEEFLNSDDLTYSEIDGVKVKIASAQGLVEAIVAAQTYNETLVDQDARLSSGLLVSIDAAKVVLADSASDVDTFANSVSHLTASQSIIDEIKVAGELITATQEFDEAKTALNLVIETTIGVLNTVGTSLADLELALFDMQNGIKAFKKALEAGDTLVELINADFEDGLSDWNVDSPTSNAAYPENKGVDGSLSITCWRGSDYQMKIFQSISGIPNGTYQISCFVKAGTDDSFALFGKSGANNSALSLLNEGGLTKRVIEIEVTNGMLQFGIRGNGVDNGVPAGNWIVFDNFEVKWASKEAVVNPGFESEFDGWISDSSPGVPYLENKGVNGSRSVTCWKGSEYFIKLSQTITGLTNGFYAVSTMAKGPNDNLYTIFGTSEGATKTESILASADLTKSKVIVQVTDGSLEFGIKGAGENNTVPAGKWIVFDDFEVVRLPELGLVNPGFEDDFTGWTNDATSDVPYIENKGVDGSKSVTFWKGSDYFAATYQTVTGLHNGTYEISAMTKAGVADVFALFGESDGYEETNLLAAGGLVKNKVIAEVSDGSLSFGIRGAGENNSIPAGKWIVFDDFELKLKSIIPEYEIVSSSIVNTELTVEKEEEKLMPEAKILYWQNGQQVNVESTNTIVKYAVYSITGVTVDTQPANNNTLSIPMKKGVFIIKVVTEDGFVDTEKVIVR